VVLIIALILLVIISLLAVTSMRSAGSAEAVAGNVRTTELATQAAEIALRHCESSAIKIVKVNSGDTTSDEAIYPTTFVTGAISVANTAQWQSTATWDSGTASFVLPTDLVGGTATYKRPPECMIELTSSGLPATVVPPASFVITARGFGPEVAAGTGRPQGSEVWLQSTIEIQ
jgi:type IV pilus assembly protein PilX